MNKNQMVSPASNYLALQCVVQI